MRGCLAPLIFLPMLGQHAADGTLHLSGLLIQLGSCAAPLPQGIGRQLAAIDGEHFPADELHVVADQQHFQKQWRNFLGHGRDEIGNGREVGLAIGRQRHEHHILMAAALDLAARSDAARIGEQDDLEQNGRMPGWRTACIVMVTIIEDRQIEFVVDEMVERMLERAREDLLRERNRD